VDVVLEGFDLVVVVVVADDVVVGFSAVCLSSDVTDCTGERLDVFFGDGFVVTLGEAFRLVSAPRKE